MTYLFNNGSALAADTAVINIADTGGTGQDAFTYYPRGAQPSTATKRVRSSESWYEMVQPNAGSSLLAMSWNGLALGEGAIRVSVDLGGNGKPPATSAMCAVWAVQDGAILCKLDLAASGQLYMKNGAGSNIWNTTASVPTSGRFDVALYFKKGTTTSDGICKAWYWASNFDGAPTESSTGVGSTGTNTGTANAALVTFGKNPSTSWQQDFFQTNMVLSTEAGTTYPALPVAPTGPNKNVKVWDGGAWINAYTVVWNGTAWVNATTTMV